MTASNGTFRFWRVSDGKPLLSYTNTGAGPIAVSPDGNYFAYGQGYQFEPDGTLFLARMPLLISEVERTNDDLRIDWQGGAGWYQVQQTTSLTSGVWMNVGSPTSGTSTNVPITSTNTLKAPGFPANPATITPMKTSALAMMPIRIRRM